MLARLFAPTIHVHAHCDLPCGVYDPAQARIEAESIKAVIAKLADNDDPDFRTRAVLIKEQRSEMVKHHLWVLWTDYFKAPHFEKYPNLHTLFNEATKLAGSREICSFFWRRKKSRAEAEREKHRYPYHESHHSHTVFSYLPKPGVNPGNGTAGLLSHARARSVLPLPDQR